MISKVTFLILLMLSSFGAFASEGGSEAHGMPDPATIVCMSRRGDVFRAKDSMSVQSFCKLDSAVIGLDTFYFAQKPGHPEAQAVRAFLSSGDPDPNFDCRTWGAQTRRFFFNTRDSFYACEFADRSMIGLETLRQGSRSVGNLQLRNSVTPSSESIN